MSTISRFIQITEAVLLISSFSIAKVQDSDIFQTLQKNASTATFLKLATQAGLGDTLESQGPYTILVPNDAAFEKLKSSDPDRYKLITTNNDVLKGLLQDHIMNSVTMTTDFKNGDKVVTLGADRINVRSNSKGLVFNGKAKIVTSNLRASNGVIQIIDTVLVPKSIRAVGK